MQALLSKIRQILKDRRTRRFFTRVVSSVAAIVIFVTTYALILPAITLEKTAACGIEEHQHSDGCYEKRLVCGQEESDGHHHDDSCYSSATELTCKIPEHLHSAEKGCYDADGNLVCELQEHVHDDSCYEEVRTLTCGQEEYKGHHHTDACYEKVLVCGKEVHTHSEKCFEEGGSTGSAADTNSSGKSSDSVSAGDIDNTGDITGTGDAGDTGDTDNTMPDVSDSNAAEEALPENDNYVPELEPLDMEAVLNNHTDLYYFHVEEGEKVPANSAEITDWRKVEEETTLASTDLVKIYLAYTIPAGSFNETNPTARYRLPGNIHLTDGQIKAINKNENGITAGFKESDPEYQKYLGAEAIEGDRTPDELLSDSAQEYISAVVRAENVYKNDKYIGQDLIFTFAPYTIEKNQETFDAEKNPVSAGEKITGWFACDFRLDQIDWIEEELQEETQEEIQDEKQEELQEETQGEFLKQAQDNIQEETLEKTDQSAADSVVITVEKTAEILFVTENKDQEIEEIKRSLKLVEQKKDAVSEEEVSKEETKEETQEFQSGTLTADGDGYKITLDYTEKAKIPENASLSVREITAETDKEAYEACLEQAGQQVAADNNTSVDQKASRFFDIEIVVTETDGDGTEKTVKIEPSAPVSVNIQIEDKQPSSQESKSDQSDPTVLHFAEEGVEQIDSTVTGSQNNNEEQKKEIQFEAESFSVYGVVYTVDFHYEINGKMYEFSIPGGGFVSLEHIVEVLGIASTNESKENVTKNTENGAESGDELGGEVPGDDVSGENGEDSTDEVAEGEASPSADSSAYEEAIKLNEVEVSEATKKFVADVERVEFSNPELVWVGKVDEETTVGGLKEANGLEVEYSAELADDQIGEINVQTVEAGDWALISVQPFTSEESLTVTVNNGDQFIVKVTDGQITSYNDIDKNKNYIIYVEYQGQYYALRNNGESVPVVNNDLDSLSSAFTWNYDYDRMGCWWYSGSKYIDVDLDYNPVAVGNTWRYSWTRSDGQGGFDINGYAHGNHHLSWNITSGFNVSNNHDISIKIYEREEPYHFTVTVNNASYGSVEYRDLETTASDKKNKTPIQAIPNANDRDCYFVKWRLNDTDLDPNEYTARIEAEQLEFPEDNMTLTAVFAKSYSSEATQHINEWVDGLLGNPVISDKTAHVYDYDNRIYEIDITASSKRYTINSGLTLEFITDASRSMYFPAMVTAVDNGSYNYTTGIDLGRWLVENGDESKVYYTVADVGATATMYAVYYVKNNDLNGAWYAMDASYYYDMTTRGISNHGGTARQIVRYTNKGQWNQNITYSISNQIKSNNGNSTFTLSGVMKEAEPQSAGKDWTRLDYLKAALSAATRALYKLDPGAQIGLLTFANEVKTSQRYGAEDASSMNTAIDTISLYGGTNQLAALNYYWKADAAYNNLNIFTPTSTKKQVAVLITDGAPNQSGLNWGPYSIGGSATNLKNRNVELYTLGLSLNDVGDTNMNGLNGIATDSSYAFQAENGDEFASKIESMLFKMLDKATLVSEVKDTIDAAFYPVDVNGNPITSGTTVTQSDGKKATYTENADGSWTVTYSNAEIGWPTVDSDDNPILDAYGNIQSPGWKTAIYIKAKEDFMGGNHINTNVGEDDHVKATGFKQVSAPGGIRNFDEPFISLLKRPYVNVDELRMDENSTEWRVYLGTDVDPKEELLQLWNKINVNLVVKDNGVDDEVITIASGNQMYYSDARDNDAAAPDDTSNETLPLSHFINSELIEGLIADLDNGQKTATSSLIYRYFPYNHTEIIGTYDIVLTKSLTDEDAATDHAPENHETKEVGEEREVYTLIVTYNPSNNDASEIYEKTTSGKSAGKVADGYDGTTGNKIDSENVHKIHVFAKDLEIQKKDMTNTSKLIDTAKFKLYRTAKKVIDLETGLETSEFESDAEDLKVGNETKKVVQIGDELTTSGGRVTVNNLSYAPDGTYYLVETKAPDGYIMATEPIEMHLYLDDAYTHYLPPKDPVNEAFTDENPYNWTQSVNRLVYDSSKTAVVDDSKITIEVLNNPGVELPATGGPGTMAFYILGIMLTAFTGAGLVMRRRRRYVA